MDKATDDERENFLIRRLMQDFIGVTDELVVKYGDIGTVPMYTALSILLCKVAIVDGMSAHDLMEGVLTTYRKLEPEYKELFK